jgi:hypothetical protein
MVSGLFGTARELPRLREISSVLVRHGLGDLVRRAGIATLLERAGHVLQWGEASEIAPLEPQQRARLAFERLGPTFVKLGQILSTREDLLPPTWTCRFRKIRFVHELLIRNFQPERYEPPRLGQTPDKCSKQVDDRKHSDSPLTNLADAEHSDELVLASVETEKSSDRSPSAHSFEIRPLL